MQFCINGQKITCKKGESLLSLVKRLGLDTGSLATRPLAARLAGQTFPLSYVPEQAESCKRHAQNRALRASNGEVHLIDFSSSRGKRIYERSLLFVFLMAVKHCFPEARTVVEYAVGAGLYCNIHRAEPLTEADCRTIMDEMHHIVKADYPLERTRFEIDDAIAFFEDDGQLDKVRLLGWRRFSHFDVYSQGVYSDYFYGEMVPSTGYVSVFDLVFHAPGLMLMRPDTENPARPASYQPMPKLFTALTESDRWARLMHCATVNDLNEMVLDGSVRQLVRVNEALHEKKYAAIADDIVSRGVKAVLIAGPSSSGKTTSANRVSTQLRVLGKTPILMSLDDYYIDRDKIAPGPDGKLDLEHINTIDTTLFSEHLAALLNGETVELPTFDFPSQKRVWHGHKLHMDADTVLVIEGLHALNPALLGDQVRREQVYKLYVSALTTLNLDDHNRIPTTSMRLLRRMVRDYETRGSSIEHTLSMWESVRRGEERWIFPYQETADTVMNTTLAYEPAVLKKHIFPLLSAIRSDSPYYEEVVSIVRALNYFVETGLEDEIPPTSILREFIGGNAFYR